MIKKIQELPTLPQVTMELMLHTFQDEPDIQIVSSIIERDPTLTAKLIKTVNSASFGLKVEVTSIPQAISLLGLEALRATIIAIALGDYFVSNAFGDTLDVKSYCSHSLATAIILQELAKALGFPSADELYLLGLLHDLDKLVLDTIEGHDYGQVLDKVMEGKSFSEAERETFGVDGHEVWVMLANTWGFPAKIIEMYHGTVQGKITVQVLELLDIASRMADELGYSFIKTDVMDPGGRSSIFSHIGEETLLQIGRAVKEQSKVTGQILELPAPDNDQVQELFLKTTHQLSLVNAELEFRIEMLKELTQVSRGIIKSLDSESLTFSIMEALLAGFHTDGVFMLQHDGKDGLTGFGNRGRDSNGRHRIEKIWLRGDRISPSIHHCLKNRIPLKVENPQEQTPFNESLPDLRLAWLTPVYVKGRFHSVLGLGVMDRTSHKFNSRDFRDILQLLAGEVALTAENARLYSQMRMEALTDPLTRINNRGTIMKILTSEFARFKRKAIPLSVAIFDMDHFKTLNDTRGHLVGDEFLIKAAEIFKGGIRESDYIGRYGGDEFIALLPDTPPEGAKVVVERIRERLETFCTQFSTPEMEVKLGVSIGVAGANESMKEANDVIQLADIALYKAKAQGKNRCIIYTDMETALKP